MAEALDNFYEELGEKSARVNIICEYLRNEGLTIGEAIEVLHDVEYALVQHSPIPNYRYSCYEKEKPRIKTGLSEWAARSLAKRNDQAQDSGNKSPAD